ncbi:MULTISPECIES: hypothetical protein [unclassified Aurantimonas]|uniref:hypothetical protein n=1 Tax=unclassified Aurantimonas TaxID=2638230 RepID=UPI002E18B6C5|nr:MULTISPECIES: hypothetical protein [unclassified Aurantimonas]MEC5291593.1 hypothetical protein [Aurantimonas sp. C2-3-R2]MEC5412677.1 hypothetical protein [Aurantimonas sp. C2-4-R8]
MGFAMSWLSDFFRGDSSQQRATRSAEDQRQARIRSGTLRINNIFDSQFNDDYFGKQRDAYSTYATPQLEDQYADAQKKLTFALARSGTLDSSMRGQKSADLQKLYDTQKQGVGDTALNFEKQTRNSVEDARANLLATLNASGDATGAVNSALSRSEALAQPQTYSPLVGLFDAFSSGLGAQAAQERAAALSGGAIKPKYSTGLFAPPASSVVTR